MEWSGEQRKKIDALPKEVFINQKNKDIDPTNQKLVAI